MSTRLEELLEKMNKPPCQLTDGEAMELQQLLTAKHKETRSDRSSAGRTFSKKRTKASIFADLGDM